MSRCSILVLLAALGIAVYAAGVGGSDASTREGGDDQSGHQRFSVALFGDVPYGPAQIALYPNLLADINAARPRFSIFDGDLKNGSTPCDDALYTTALANFDALDRPLLWVPGDNDWTDCHRANNGSFDPLERLAHERQLFASTDQSLGRKTLTLARQLPSFPENWRVRVGPVVFVGLNVQGSNNNFPHVGVDREPRDRVHSPLFDAAAEIAREDAEFQARDAADIQWLRESFAAAKAAGARGVMVVWQADPDLTNEQSLQPTQFDGFTNILAALRTETLGFPGQVALVHGDSHYFKVDKPLLLHPGGDNAVVANFTRVETFGDQNTHWVEATIDAQDPNVFEFSPRVVPPNVGS